MRLFNIELNLVDVAFAAERYDDFLSGVTQGDQTYATSPTSLFLILTAFIILLLLHFCFFALNLINSSSVSNLFLSIEYMLVNKSKSPLMGYLRVLDKHSATIISSSAADRGENIKINFNSVVHFPRTDNPYVNGNVRSCRKLSGNPVSYIIKVSFDNLDETFTQSLESYLTSLKKKKW